MFTLTPFRDDELTRPGALAITVRTKQPVAEVWDGIAGARPLHWCVLLHKIEWTSPLPRAVGATRRATLFPGAYVDERYVAWEESADRCFKAFTVLASSFPGLARFGETYEVVATPEGSEFRWTFSTEPRHRAFAPVLRLVMRLAVRQLRRDTERYFALLDAAVPLRAAPSPA